MGLLPPQWTSRCDKCPSVAAHEDGYKGGSMSNAIRHLPVIIEQTPALQTNLRVTTITLADQPPALLTRLAAGPGWLFLVPVGMALLFFYGRFFTLVLMQAPRSEWALMGGVGGILIGWPVRALVLYALSKQFQGCPSFVPLLNLSAWATLPLTLRDAVQVLYMVSMGRLLIYPGLSGLLVQNDTATTTGLEKAGHFLLGKLDLYAICYLVLLVVAVRIGAQVSKPKAVLIVALYSILILVATGFVALL